MSKGPSFQYKILFGSSGFTGLEFQAGFMASAFHLSSGKSLLAEWMEGLWVSSACLPARGPALPARKCLVSSSFGWSEREQKENTLAYLCQQRVWQAAASHQSCALRAVPGEHPWCCRAHLLPITLHSGLTRQLKPTSPPASDALHSAGLQQGFANSVLIPEKWSQVGWAGHWHV